MRAVRVARTEVECLSALEGFIFAKTEMGFSHFCRLGYKPQYTRRVHHGCRAPFWLVQSLSLRLLEEAGSHFWCLFINRLSGLGPLFLPSYLHSSAEQASTSASGFCVRLPQVSRLRLNYWRPLVSLKLRARARLFHARIVTY